MLISPVTNMVPLPARGLPHQALIDLDTSNERLPCQGNQESSG
jgi:hypothetical protein